MIVKVERVRFEVRYGMVDGRWDLDCGGIYLGFYSMSMWGNLSCGGDSTSRKPPPPHSIKRRIDMTWRCGVMPRSGDVRVSWFWMILLAWRRAWQINRGNGFSFSFLPGITLTSIQQLFLFIRAEFTVYWTRCGLTPQCLSNVHKWTMTILIQHRHIIKEELHLPFTLLLFLCQSTFILQ